MVTGNGTSRKWWAVAAAVLLLMASDISAQALTASTAPSSGGGPVAGLPTGAAAAALDAEPRLPTPTGWSFPDDFSRTAGTGRLIDGAFEWTDWVYDAWGASGSGSNSDLSQTRGSYVYPSGPSDADGADIFRAAVGLTSTATIWRVDWNTLVQGSVPIAEWAFDTDDNSATGGSAWPAGANVSSPGIDKALVMSAKGAELIDAINGKTIATFPTTVDMSSRSFLVSVPLSVLPVSGKWRVRLAAGLADSSGTGFALPDLASGQPSATTPRVYNITFRTAAQEPDEYSAAGQSDSEAAPLASALEGSPGTGAYGIGAAVGDAETGNTWGDADQADTLATGDVSKFSQLVNWSQLAAGAVTQPPLVYGWSTRWYVTDLNLGQGIATGQTTQPQLLGRIQPYAVYVPTNYTGAHPVPLTWLLHGAEENYTWAATSLPRFSAEACQDRGSVCVSPEGLGGVGFYIGQAEHDFWQVWRQMALGFNLYPNRTVVTGYSMGGVGSFILSATYPSVFSEAMPLDGSFDDGCTPVPSTLASLGAPPIEAEGASYFTMPAAANRAANVHWVPMVVSSAYPDELSLYPHILIDTQRYIAAGDRFTLFSTTGGEHVVTLLEDGFSTQVAALNGTPQATADPGTIDYTWCPEVVSPSLGLGPKSLYWISGLSERAATSSSTSHVVAADQAIPEPVEAEDLNASLVAPPDAPPMQVLTGSWSPGATPAAVHVLTLTLTNVAGLTIDTAAGRLPYGSATVDTDGPTTLTLSELAPGVTVHVGTRAVRAGSTGTAVVPLAAGTSTLTWH